MPVSREVRNVPSLRKACRACGASDALSCVHGIERGVRIPNDVACGGRGTDPVSENACRDGPGRGQADTPLEAPRQPKLEASRQRCRSRARLFSALAACSTLGPCRHLRSKRCRQVSRRDGQVHRQRHGRPSSVEPVNLRIDLVRSDNPAVSRGTRIVAGDSLGPLPERAAPAGPMGRRGRHVTVARRCPACIVRAGRRGFRRP